ncbi:hypothetical protein L596_001090 [Steinernema carpocapsae]|uniref:Uncharacterized protein n=1 Tax=Steinernema carpocapsae TaxID=34508 RepID=A0A4U8UKR7_STECR|nr:hypothetical protein L596_001090 [Steinernema carpocapsae]
MKIPRFHLGIAAYQPGADERALVSRAPDREARVPDVRSVLGGPGADVLRVFWYRSGLQRCPVRKVMFGGFSVWGRQVQDFSLESLPEALKFPSEA